MVKSVIKKLNGQVGTFWKVGWYFMAFTLMSEERLVEVS